MVRRHHEPRVSEERYRLLVESLSDYAVFLLDPDGRVASWNKGAELIKGWSAKEIVGQHYRRFFPQDAAKAGRPEQLLGIAAAEGRVEDEGWRVRKDGSLFWASAVLTALKVDGKLAGFAKVTRDMTERRRNEELLRQSEERFRLLIDSVKDYAIFMLDPNGRVASWNPGAQRLKGYASSEIVGRHFSIFYPSEDVEAGKPAAELKTAAGTGRYEEEGWRLRKDGTRFWASVVISAVRAPSGELVGFSKVTRDLTARKAQDESLRSALADLRRANHELEDYAAFVSHDLQEPLRKMASFAELLRVHSGPAVDETGNSYISRIVEGAERMRRLITDVLEYSRIGRAEAEPGPVELEAAVRDALSDLEHAVRECGAELKVGPLPAVRGNRTLLTRLFQNLLSNALKFRREGVPPRIRVEAARERGEWVVTVSDNGIGFDPAHAADILRPFRRLHEKERFPGTGLGLAGAKKIVEHHGGRLWARSEPGKGSTFHVALPAGGRRL
jgi:PAS domain S-box-containing protein